MLNLFIKRVLFTTVLFISVVALSFAQEQLENDLKNIMKKHEAIGLAVAVVKNNKIIYTTSLGFKNQEKQEPIDKNDIFRIASISKSFVATCIMQLVEEGKLSLDDDVSKLIGFTVRNPKYPEQKITLKMLLSHRSSLSDQNGYFALDVIDPRKTADVSQSYYDYAPGEGYQYCNLNFNLAGAILEKTTGQRLDLYVAKQLLKPLKLYAGYNVDSLDSNRFVKLYEYDRETKTFHAANAYPSPAKALQEYTLGYSTPIFSPTGGMKISAEDLATYMMMHMNYGKYKNKRIISEESAKTMQTKWSEEEGYGLALRTVDDLLPGVVLKGHNGDAYGLYSSMLFQPQEKFGFVLITNGCNTPYQDGVNAMLQECIKTLYQHLIVAD